MNTMLLILALVLPPCATEDSNWCQWDGNTRGNKTGVSFVTLADVTFILGEAS